MKVTFIGHRYIYNREIENRLYEEIERQIKNGCHIFRIGTHGDFDKLALSVCRKLREIYQDIVIEVVLTSLNQIKPLIIDDPVFGSEKYIPYCDVTTIMYEIEDEHFKRKITISNQKMIADCDILICYVDSKRTYGGARFGLNYAKKKGLKIINLF